MMAGAPRFGLLNPIAFHVWIERRVLAWRS